MLLVSERAPVQSPWTPEVVATMWGDLEAKPRFDGSYMIRCPFPDHLDRKPSASLAAGERPLDTAVWYCFACAEGGGVPQLIEAIEGLEKGEGYQRMLLLESSSEFGKVQERSKNVKCGELPSPPEPAYEVWDRGRVFYDNQPKARRTEGLVWLLEVAARYGLAEDEIELLNFEVHDVFRDFEHYLRLRLPSYSPGGELVSWVEWLSKEERRAFDIERKRKFSWGRPKPTLGLLDVSDSTKVIVLTEGESDYLQAFGAMLRRSPSYVVVGAPGSGAMVEAVEGIVERIKGDDLPTLVVCGDGDEAGDAGAAEAINLWCDLGGKSGQVRPPNGKDLRDLLLEDEAHAVTLVHRAVEYASYEKPLVLAKCREEVAAG